MWMAMQRGKQNGCSWRKYGGDCRLGIPLEEMGMKCAEVLKDSGPFGVFLWKEFLSHPSSSRR